VTAANVLSNAELALAAYAVLQPGLTRNQLNDLQFGGNGLSLKQAQEFALRYPEVIAQVEDDESGFSMTVFRDASGSVALAMRGSEPQVQDWLPTNSNILINGAGYQQIAALHNAWQRLTHRIGEAITLCRVDLSNVTYPVIAETAVNDLGTATAPLISPGALVDVAGHSLGGHLALAFAGLFPINARQVHAFNAPGFIDSTPNRNFFARLGGQLPVGATPGGVPTLNVIADAQAGAGESFTLAAGLHSRPGTPLNIAIENQVTGDEPVATKAGPLNHSQMILTDSLAVFALLSRLAPALSAASFESLLGSAALGTVASLERIVDGLAQTLGIDRDPLPTSNANRNALYEAIYALQSNVTYLALAGSAALRVLAETDPATLEEKSKSDFGYFLAVQELLPIAVEGAGGPLIAAHPDLYARWSADRAKRVGGASSLEFTDIYLSDRAQMLAFLMIGNTNDTTAFASNQVNDQVLYSDLAKRPVAVSSEGEPTSLNVFMVGGTPNPRGPNTRVIGFGTDGVDALQGRENRDRLYGGKGADLLQGGKGDDYLEGGEGMDVYAYGAGTSAFSSDWNDGDDEIRDTDQQGVILYTFTGSGTAGTSSHLIGGAAVQLDGTHWQSADGKFKYDQEGSDLRVRIDGDAEGSLLIRDFDFVSARQSGSFGIRLIGASITPTANLEFEGDRRVLGSYYYIDPVTGVGEWREPDPIPYDVFGNVIRDPSLVVENVSDVFHGSPDSDAMYGRGGNDRLFGESGDDVLFGGDGSDYIEGGEGNDLIAGHDPETPLVGLYDELHGGDGNDLIFAGAVQTLEEAFLTGGSTLLGDTSQIYGEAGDDTLVGSSLIDVIRGGSGNDLIIGGAGVDALDGGDGDDVLYAGIGGASMVGGIGNDTLFADDDPTIGSILNGGTNGYGPGDGDDLLIGSSNGRDTMQGGEGSDLVFAGGGNDRFADSYWAYFAPDTIYMEEGNDSVSASHGDDFIDGGDGNDNLNGNGGDDVIYGGAGDDRLEGDGVLFAAIDPGNGGPLTFVAITPGDDTLYGEEGDDTLLGGGGNDSLIGDVGNDALRGGSGDDWLDGGPGDDSLQGGSGGDTYAFNVGDGVDAIVDFDEGLPGPDAVFFGEGIAPEDLVLQASPLDTSLFVVLPRTGERMEIRSWFADEEGFGGEQFTIESFVFADGTTWDSAEIESKVAVGGPTPGRDQLAGTSGDDVIHALAGADQITDTAGNDILYGDEGGDRITDNDGHNLLVGGDGNELLQLNGAPIYDENGEQIGLEGGSPGSFAIGGAGSDGVLISDHSLIAYNAGDSEDSIRWTEGDVQLLTISLGGGISIEDISLFYSMDTSLLMVGLGSEILPDVEGDYVPLEAIVLPNLMAQPELWPTIVLQVIGDDVRSYNLGPVVEAYNVELAQNPTTTRWSATQALQANLLGVSTTHALGGAIAYQYATSGSVEGLTPAQIRSVLVGADFGVAPQSIAMSTANSAPLVSNAITDMSADEDAAFAFTVPADTFSDPDAGDVLTYTTSLADGTALPAWLSFDVGTRTFSGTPLQTDVGALDFTVTATDAGGLSAPDTFTLTVANVNDAPIVASPLADLSFEAGSTFSFGVPAGTFADEDPGDTLSLSATLLDSGAPPAWLSFEPTTAVFTGNPSATDIGISPILVTAVDGSGAAAQSTFGLVVRVPVGAEATGSAGDDVIYGGTGDETLTAKGGNDYLFGDVGNDLLKGGGGNDVLQGGAGSDVLRGGKGQNVLDGGAGNDLIFGGAGSAFIAGGAGNDILRVGNGNDVIAFNAGDGMDTVYGGRDGGNTLSFGGGIRYSDLSLSKSGKDLVVSTGAGEGVTVKNWYGGNHSVLNLQIMLDATEDFDAGSSDSLYNRRVQTFDFLGMVSAFDAARAATPGLTSWEMTNALLAFHLSGADEMAIGGDLASWYGKNRTLAGISLQSAQQVIGAANFGSEAQTLRPFSGLQEGFVKLA
jgi:Ca2+-binding RTX toxin-like protein